MKTEAMRLLCLLLPALVAACAPAAAQPPACLPGGGSAPVQAPAFVRNLAGQTSWYASPVVYDLDGDGANELIAAYYDVYVFSSQGVLLDRAQIGNGRVYAPHVVADLDGDGTTEVVVGRGREVIAFEWTGTELTVKSGWPADTTTGGNAPEVRGMAAADLDGDGAIEVVVTTTQTVPSADGGAQVFVFSPDGSSYQPAAGHAPAWPRYNALSGPGNDADRNGQGHNGFGCYGLNVGIGNIDDDPALEVLATYDNHHIQAFDHDGVAIDASDYYTNRSSSYLGNRMTWGQFIRWADPQVEDDHYNAHTGTWPHPNWAEWLQWTASPPGVVDLDGDGRGEVVAVPNVERNVPYVTQAYAVMVLEGAHGDGSRSARREAGWEQLPRGDAPIQVSGWYPPYGVPAPTLVDIAGDTRPEILVSLNDGYVYAFDAGGSRLWRTSYRHAKPIMFASEVTVADLNRDAVPELLLATYGDPDVHDSGRLMILSNAGAVLHDIALPNPGHNGNGNGAPAAPAIGDLDGDGALEVFVQTFDHGMDVFTVPGSAGNCLLWPTARGGPLRMGQQNGDWMLGQIFTDGFEYGGTAAWSRTDPPAGTGGGPLTVSADSAATGAYGLEADLGACPNPEGADVEVVGPTLGTGVVVEACGTLSAGDVEVTGAGVVFRAGRSIVLGPGFTVRPGAGLSAEIDPGLVPTAYLEDAWPEGESVYKAAFRLRLDRLALDAGDGIGHFAAYRDDGTPQLLLVLKRVGAENRLILEAREDDGTFRSTEGTAAELPVPSGYQSVEVTWRAALPGQGNGSAGLAVGGRSASLTQLGNSAGRIDTVRWGVLSAADPASGGAIEIDGFSSTRVF